MGVTIDGVGSTKYDEHPDSSSRELFGEAAADALGGTALTPGDLDAVYVGNLVADLIEDQGHLGPLLANAVGARSAASVRVESACASGGAAFRQAVGAIESSRADAVLVGGVEQLSVANIEHVTDALANAADDVYENEQGLTFPGIYALMARRYMHEFDATRADLAAVSVKNRGNAVANPLAQFQTETSIEAVLESRPIATPLHLYDACRVSDGASVAILVSDDFAADHGLDGTVSVLGTGQASDALALQDRATVSRIPAATRAAEAAYERAGITVDDVDVMEVHDCFTIAEILALESLGVYERGAGARGAVEGETALDGSLPVNTSGGLLGKGHPVGATGVGQIVELTKQLEGRHPNQVAGAETALAHNVGGSGASTTVTVLGGGLSMPAWFDAFVDDLASGDGWALDCESCGERTLPPRRVCPACGSSAMTRTPLSGRGTVLTFTEITITIPKFHGETPYTVVLVELDEGPRLTGQLRDATADDVAIGDAVVLGTEPHDGGTAVLTFRPAA
jgi:acetyl-CoA acetyltransferase/uncharacterized OB-fold protein